MKAWKDISYAVEAYIVIEGRCYRGGHQTGDGLGLYYSSIERTQCQKAEVERFQHCRGGRQKDECSSESECGRTQAIIRYGLSWGGGAGLTRHSVIIWD